MTGATSTKLVMLRCYPRLLRLAALGLAPELARSFSLNRGGASSSETLGISDAGAEATKGASPAATAAAAAAAAVPAAALEAREGKVSVLQQPAIMRRASSPATSSPAVAAVQRGAIAVRGSHDQQPPPPLLPTDDVEQGGSMNPFAFDAADGLTDLAYYISLETCESNTLLPPSGGFIFRGVPDLGVCGCKDWSTPFADPVSSTSCQHQDDGALEIVIRQGLGCQTTDPMVLMVPGPELENLREGKCVMVNFPDSTTAYIRYEQFAVRNDRFCACEALTPPPPPGSPTAPPPHPTTREPTTTGPTTTEPPTTERRAPSTPPPAKPRPEPPAPALPFEADDDRTDLAYYPSVEMCNSGTTAGGGGGFWYPGVPDLSSCGCLEWRAPFHGGGSYSARHCEEVNGDLSIRIFSGASCREHLEAAVIRVPSQSLTPLSQGRCVPTEGEVLGAPMEHFVRLEGFKLSGRGFCLCDADTQPMPAMGEGEGGEEGDDQGEESAPSTTMWAGDDEGKGDVEGDQRGDQRDHDDQR